MLKIFLFFLSELQNKNVAAVAWHTCTEEKLLACRIKFRTLNCATQQSMPQNTKARQQIIFAQLI